MPESGLAQWQKDFSDQLGTQLSNMSEDALGAAYRKAHGTDFIPEPELHTDGMLKLGHLIAQRDGDSDMDVDPGEQRMHDDAVWRRAERKRLLDAEIKRRGLKVGWTDGHWTLERDPAATAPSAPAAPNDLFAVPPASGIPDDPHIDTGHYDDGHSFDWKRKPDAAPEQGVDTAHYDDGHSFGWKAAPDEPRAAEVPTTDDAGEDDGTPAVDEGAMPTTTSESNNWVDAFAGLASRPGGKDTASDARQRAAAAPPKEPSPPAVPTFDDQVGPSVDTGHYDDGHAFGWQTKKSAKAPARAPVGVLGAIGLVIVAAIAGFAFMRPSAAVAPASTAAATTAAARATQSAAPSANAPAAGATPSPGPSAPTAASAGYTCTGASFKLFDNWNTSLETGGGTPATVSTNGKSYCVVTLATYHYNGGKGAIPGQIWLTSAASNVTGQAVGTTGQGGVPDANWVINWSAGHEPLLSGTYTCRDSDPATWAQNDGSQHIGFCRVWVTEAVK